MSAGDPQFYGKYILYITKLYRLYNNIIKLRCQNPLALAGGYRHRPLGKDQNVHFFRDVWSKIVV